LRRECHREFEGYYWDALEGTTVATTAHRANLPHSFWRKFRAGGISPPLSPNFQLSLEWLAYLGRTGLGSSCQK
jgi:hypothetical protein